MSLQASGVASSKRKRCTLPVNSFSTNLVIRTSPICQCLIRTPLTCLRPLGFSENQTGDTPMLPVPHIPAENKSRCWLAVAVIVGILRQRLEADEITFFDRAAF